MLPYRILNNKNNISIAIPQRHAKSRGLAEGSPIARSGLGTDPRVCSPTDPTGDRTKVQEMRKSHGKSVKASRPGITAPKTISAISQRQN
jgi:hypothetical protein